MEKAVKEQLVTDLQQKFSTAKGFFVTDYSGLNVAQVTELRRKLRESSIEYKVVKNTLARLALNNLGYQGLDEHFLGPTAVAYAFKDPAAPAKIIEEFLKSHRELQKPEIKIGVIEKQVLSAADMKDIVNLPSRETLIAMLLGGLNAPISGFVGVLNSLLTKLVLVLKAVEEKKSQE